MNWFAKLLLKARRWSVQLAALLILNSYFLAWLKQVPCPVLNCYACPLAVLACPIGTLQHFSIIHRIPFFTLGLLGLIGSLVGRLSCGWFCPFGFLQDLSYRLKTPKLSLSNSWGWLRYLVLILLVGLIPLLTLEPWFCKLCPMGTLEGGIPLVLTDSTLRALIGRFFWLKAFILVVFLAWMILTKRPFCRFICPLGAIYSLFNRLSALQLVISPENCHECDHCRQVCPMDISVPKDLGSTQCIRCLECIQACPQGVIGFTEVAP